MHINDSTPTVVAGSETEAVRILQDRQGEALIFEAAGFPEEEVILCPDRTDCSVQFDEPEPEVGFPGARWCETHNTDLPFRSF